MKRREKERWENENDGRRLLSLFYLILYLCMCAVARISPLFFLRISSPALFRIGDKEKVCARRETQSADSRERNARGLWARTRSLYPKTDYSECLDYTFFRLVIMLRNGCLVTIDMTGVKGRTCGRKVQSSQSKV